MSPKKNYGANTNPKPSGKSSGAKSKPSGARKKMTPPKPRGSRATPGRAK